MFIVLMSRARARFARYYGIPMLPFGRAIAIHGSAFDVLRDNLF